MAKDFNNSMMSVQGSGPGPGFGVPTATRRYGEMGIGQAMQDIGRGFRKLGEAQSNEGKVVQDRAEGVRRISERSVLMNDANKAWSKFSNDLNTNQDPSSYSNLFKEFESTLNEATKDIEDPEVKAEHEMWLSGKTQSWRADMNKRSWDKTEANIVDTLNLAAAEAIEQREDSLFIGPIDELVKQGRISQEKRDLVVAQTQKQIQKHQERDYVWNKAGTEGYEAALEYLTDPKSLKDNALTPEEMGVLQREVENKYDTAQALEKRRDDAAMEKEHDSLTASAYQGEIGQEELDEMWDKVEGGLVDERVAASIQTLVKKPRTRSDPKAFYPLGTIEKKLTSGKMSPEQAIMELEQNAHRLIDKDYEAYRSAFEYIRKNGVDVLDLPEHEEFIKPIMDGFDSRLSKEDAFSSKWHQTNADIQAARFRMRSWLLDPLNENATDEQKRTHFNRISGGAAKVGALSKAFEKLGWVSQVRADTMETFRAHMNAVPRSEDEFNMVMAKIKQDKGEGPAIAYRNQHINLFDAQAVPLDAQGKPLAAAQKPEEAEQLFDVDVWVDGRYVQKKIVKNPNHNYGYIRKKRDPDYMSYVDIEEYVKRITPAKNITIYEKLDGDWKRITIKKNPLRVYGYDKSISGESVRQIDLTMHAGKRARWDGYKVNATKGRELNPD